MSSERPYDEQPTSRGRPQDQFTDQKKVQKYINQGWPDSKNALPLEVQQFWCVRDELYVSEGLVLRREKFNCFEFTPP